MDLVCQALPGVLQTLSVSFEFVYIGHKQTQGGLLCSQGPCVTRVPMQADQTGFMHMLHQVISPLKATPGKNT